MVSRGDRRWMAVTLNTKVISMRRTYLRVSGSNLLQPLLQVDLALEPKIGKGTTVEWASEGFGQFAIFETGVFWDQESYKIPSTVAYRAYRGVAIHVVVLGVL